MQGTNDAGQCFSELAISASGNSVSNGTVVFSNSNNVSFGMSGSTVTASASSPADVPFAVSASGSSISSGTVVFSNSNNVSFGMNGSTVTGSASFSQSTAPSAISASGSSASSGTIVFSNSNNVSFGMNGNTITASATVSQSTSPGAIAAGTQTATSGTIVFSNSNGFSFGMSNSSQITFADQSFSEFYNWRGAAYSFAAYGNATLHVQPITAPNVVFSQFGFGVFFQGSSNTTASVSFSLSAGFYTRNGNSLSFLTSISTSGSIDHSGTVNSATNAGMRWATVGWSSTLTKGHYWVGMISSTTGSQLGSVSLSLIAASQLASGWSGLMGVASVASQQASLGFGTYSAATAAFPAAIGFNEINGAGVAVLMRPSIFHIAVSTT